MRREVEVVQVRVDARSIVVIVVAGGDAPPQTARGWGQSVFGFPEGNQLLGVQRQLGVVEEIQPARGAGEERGDAKCPLVVRAAGQKITGAPTKRAEAAAVGVKTAVVDVGDGGVVVQVLAPRRANPKGGPTAIHATGRPFVRKDDVRERVCQSEDVTEMMS